ncbi:MAG: ATP-binding protein [Solirubrobacteraceae bacterium]
MASISRSDTDQSRELERTLGSVDDAVAGAGLPDAARRLVRARAESLYASSGRGAETLPIAKLSYAGELLSLIAVDLAADPREARRLIERLDQRAAIPRVLLGREILQSGRLLGLPVGVAIEVRLALLMAFTASRSVTLWTLAGAEPKLVSGTGGNGAEGDYARELAEVLLGGGPPPAPVTGGRGMAGVVLERLRPPPAALVADAMEANQDQGELLLAAAAPALSALLDRQALMVREGPSQEAVLGSVERRLARLRFDLHDGPQQDVHLLAQDLALFREQLRPMISSDPNAGRLLGRLDDLQAQLVALDGDLRRLSSSVHSPLLIPGSLRDALRSVTDGFTTRTTVVPQVRVEEPLPELTDSQQIALLSLVREALSNIRKHSDASHVGITISSEPSGLRVVIRDDGKGFDPEESLVLAARAGRMGLVGMHERVRMLGGITQIDSRPGGPTVISATLPPWPNVQSASPR